MTSSPVARALLILTLLMASEVSSAPREELIRQQDSKQETFRETREAEVLEHRSENENTGQSREYEMRHRLTRLVKEPLPPEHEGEVITTTKKPPAVDKGNGTLETKDMTESIAPVQVDDDSEKSNQTLATTAENNNSKRNDDNDDKKTTKPAAVETSENNILTDQAKSPVNATETTTTTTVPTTSSTVTSTIVVTTETTTTTSTTQPSVPTIITSTTTTTAKPTVTTENSPKNEVITESTVTIVSPKPSKAELQLHSKKVEPMPSGIVALITAIAFAIVAVMAYVGLVVWRRYLEWRYGNRELLVNDFDANDIGNFEL